MNGPRHWLRSRWRRRHPTPTIAPDQAYRCWAPTYGNPPNELQRLEEKSLRELLPDLRARRLLDVGCGRGRVGRLAIRRGAGTAVGLDATLRMLGFGTTPGRPLVAAGATGLPFRDASFDVAVAGLVLGHVADLASALCELSRVVRKDGVLVVSDFHPFATLRGWQRTFTDPDTGSEIAIESHAHLLADYVGVLGRLGWMVEALSEPLWEGFPVVFVLRARRRQGEG